ncbi:MAG: 30S ribosomal protein S12 methylthiotransferase RimO [Candidatus Latescibacterota bacterium]|jgi:ribosomal protein S12 methylthiotransferase
MAAEAWEATGRTADKVHLISLGCPRNTVDSERMLGLLQGNAYELTDDPQQADVVVVNTCGFIGPAKEESIETIMAAHRLKETGRCRAVIVTGCLATRYETELRQELVEADRLLTISQEDEIVREVDQALGRRRGRYLDHLPRVGLTPRHWSYLRISDGCDHQCAFCAIPAIRGRHRSEPVERLVDEAERLVTAGVRELVLVSQDAMRYGADLEDGPNLAGLLRRLAEVRGIRWLRLMYTYPAFWTDELIETFAAGPPLCAYVDMPLQHIADPLLRRMKRATTQRQTTSLLERLRRALPGAGFRSTFIVGFPGETEAQFTELLGFVEAARFDHVTGFVYSPEEGTAAAGMDDQVEPQVAEERYGRLTELQERISAEINGELVGTRHEVLVDERDPDTGTCLGRLERDAPEIDGQVSVDGTAARPGDFVEVEITSGYAYERTARATGEPH